MKLSVVIAVTLIRGVTSVALIPLLVCPLILHSQPPATDDHIISVQALQQRVESSSEARQENIITIQKFMSSSIAERAIRDAKMDPVQVKTAIPMLSDEELSNLSARSRDAQQNFSAGHFGPGLLTIIVIAVAVIVIVSIVH